jgi:hypothetical protein
MRILVNYMNRNGWSIHCLAPDCQTLISGWVTVRTEETLLRLLKASGATPAEMDEIERDMKQQGRGSTFIEANETGRRSCASCRSRDPSILLGIMPEPKLYAFSTTIGTACNQKSRTFQDLAERLKLGVHQLMKECNAKVPPSKALVKSLARELDLPESMLDKLAEEVRKDLGAR